MCVFSLIISLIIFSNETSMVVYFGTLSLHLPTPNYTGLRFHSPIACHPSNFPLSGTSA